MGGFVLDGSRAFVYSVNMPAPTRQRIRRAARELFLRHGPEGVSTRRIARRLGLTAPALYRHYASRAELLEEIADEGFELLARSLSEASDLPTARERILAMADRYLNFALAHPRHFDWMFLRTRARARRFPDDFAEGRSPTASPLIREVETAMVAGELRRDDVLETSLSLWAEAHGLIALFRAGRFALEPVSFRALYRRSLERTLRGLSR